MTTLKDFVKKILVKEVNPKHDSEAWEWIEIEMENGTCELVARETAGAIFADFKKLNYVLTLSDIKKLKEKWGVK
jgi:hypothetical protein